MVLFSYIKILLSYLYLLWVHSEKHLKQYAEELSSATGGTEQSFYETYNKAKEGKFDFLLLDFRKLRALKNLDTILYDRDEEFNNTSKAAKTKEDLDKEEKRLLKELKN